MYINCINKNHTDNNASAILNDTDNGHVIGSVRCLGCGKWYMYDSPDITYNTYKELLASIDGSVSLKNIKDGEILPYPKLHIESTRFGHYPKKSRTNFEGQTIKSNLKSDKLVNNIYVDKIPKVANDYKGTHESVKEFFYNEERNKIDSIDTNKGFYNRISIDSDDTGDILPRLNKLVKYAGVSGFWLMLNNGNNKFQANINFSHTVTNGHDITKVKEVAKCLNNLVGDYNMTNSFMKNHKVFDNTNNNTIKDAQRTRTYGFDYYLQKDFEDYINNISDYNWNNKWLNKISRGDISIDFINSKTGNSEQASKDSICFIVAPEKREFNIRKDKSWAMPIELLWSNTAIKYARKKTNKSVLYTNEEYSKQSQYNIMKFHTVSSILSDGVKSKYKNKIINQSFSPNVEKYVDYYKNNMRAYNPYSMAFEYSQKLNTFKLLRYLLDNNDELLRFTVLLKTAQHNGYVSITRKNGLFKNWGYLCSSNFLSNELCELMKESSYNEIESLRKLLPIFIDILSNPYVCEFENTEYQNIVKELKPYYSIANEVTYYGTQHMLKGIEKKHKLVLNEISNMDFESYKKLSILFILSKLMEVDFGGNESFKIKDELGSKRGLYNKYYNTKKLLIKYQVKLFERGAQSYLREAYYIGYNSISRTDLNFVMFRTKNNRPREHVP